MRLLHLIPSLRKGGAERLVLDICRELSKRPEVRCKLVVMHEHNEYSHLSEGLDIKICNSRVVPSITNKWQIDLAHWQSIVQDFKPDIIHSHLFEAEMMSRTWLYRKATYFSHCHDNMIQLNKLKVNTLFNKKKTTNYYERSFILPRYNRIRNKFIAISSHTQKHFEEHLPNKLAKNIILLHNAIDYKKFISTQVRHISSQPIQLISVGSLVSKKNQSFLIDVVQLLMKKGINNELHLLGEGTKREHLTREIQALGLENKVILHGNVEDVPSHLHLSSIYVHAATSEAFGLVLLEAMAAGLPVVCLDGGGNRDLILQGKNGFMVNQPNPIQFANYIKQLVEQPDLYKSMSAFAQEFAADYDIGAYVDRLTNLYKQNLNEN